MAGTWHLTATYPEVKMQQLCLKQEVACYKHEEQVVDKSVGGKKGVG